MGGYFLPFFGVSAAETLKWKSLGGDFDLIQNEGHSLGVRLGHSWNIFFLDFQLSYYENEIKKLDLTDGLVFDLFGDVKGLSYHASIGAKMYINTRSFLSFGAGVGASDQSVSFELMEVVQQEDDVLLSYQVFAGLEYYPTDHFRIGLRYRWMLSEGMDLFSSQELHLGELSLGYSH
jgi:opacity protein-like surface antigen